MIVRDNRSPRGRYEESPPRPYVLPDFMVGREAGGTSWREQNATGEARARLFGQRERAPWFRPVVTLTCEECGKPFEARQAKVAHLCSPACRQRRYKRAHADEIRARRHAAANAA